MNKRRCINIAYRNQQEIKIMNRMHVNRGDVQAQLEWVEHWSPKERQYTCGACPTYGMCQFMNRYGIGDTR